MKSDDDANLIFHEFERKFGRLQANVSPCDSLIVPSTTAVQDGVQSVRNIWLFVTITFLRGSLEKFSGPRWRVKQDCCRSVSYSYRTPNYPNNRKRGWIGFTFRPQAKNYLFTASPTTYRGWGSIKGIGAPRERNTSSKHNAFQPSIRSTFLCVFVSVANNKLQKQSRKFTICWHKSNVGGSCLANEARPANYSLAVRVDSWRNCEGGSGEGSLMYSVGYPGGTSEWVERELNWRDGLGISLEPLQ